MVWLISSIAAIAGISLVLGSITGLLGRRLLREFTRPGITVEQGTPQWGGWRFPEIATEPVRELRRAVILKTADGVLLRGEFWAQTRGAPTIIISHGFHLPSRYFRPVAALEYAHGANILLFDYRGHGESSLVPTTCGNAEVNDLTAAIEFAMSQPETLPGQIYIHGFSMGAAVSLLLPPHTAIAGIIADSPYARLDEMIRMLVLQILQQETAAWRGVARLVHPLLPVLTRLTLLGGRFLFYARYRLPLVARPDRVIGRHPRAHKGVAPLPVVRVATPILLIHAEHDPFVSLHHAHRLAELARAAGRKIQVYYTPSTIHCGSYGHDPQRYMALLQSFIAL